MTTHTLRGFVNDEVDGQDNTSTNLHPATISIIVPDGRTTFSYDYISGDDVRFVNSQFYDVVVVANGQTLRGPELSTFESEIFEVTAGSGTKTKILQFHDPDIQRNCLFQIDGDPSPVFADFADAAAFEEFV